MVTPIDDAALAAQLDEDERVALAAGADPDRPGAGVWERECCHAPSGDPPCDEEDCCVVDGDGIRLYDEGGHDRDHADHIVRHDPARVLAHVAMVRALLARIARLETPVEEPCATCDHARDDHHNGVGKCREPECWCSEWWKK